MNFFITGTDTGVGKTYFTALLTRSLRKAGFDTVALKPICCGSRDDVAALAQAADHELSANVINPVWLPEPAAPYVAAREAGESIDLDALEKWFGPIHRHHRSVLVEGAGGWLVPLTKELMVADLAVRFGLPVLVVVANKLGCLNHTLLTVESIRARGLTCGGLVLNHLDSNPSLATETNGAILREICDVPILFEVHPGQTEIELAVA